MKHENLYKKIDFQFAFSKEMIEENGEDSFYSELNDDCSVLAVFDGCGGLGSKEYSNFSGKTGAYMASRIVCGATKLWFSMYEGKVDVDVYKSVIDNAMDIAYKYADKESVVIKGSMQKTFPTTISVALSEIKSKNIEVTYIWAGDSRGYLLDEDGLHQITQDDISGEDAMSNLSNDGVLTNVVYHKGKYDLHTRQMKLKKPSVIFCATDGCFGYLSTPMEFEEVLLDCLLKSESPDEWKSSLIDSLGMYACDDYSLALMVTGFNTFKSLKKTLSIRSEILKKKYTANIDKKTYDEKVDIWNKYKINYEYNTKRKDDK